MLKPSPEQNAPSCTHDQPKVFLKIVVMVYHTEGIYHLQEVWSQLVENSFLSPAHDACLQDLEWIEFFAGHSACTQSMRRAGVRGARLDFAYFKKSKTKSGRPSSNYFDILSDSGFMFLVCIVLFVLICTSSSIISMAISNQNQS